MNALEYFEPISNNKNIQNSQLNPPIDIKRVVERQKKQKLNSNVEKAVEISVKIIINTLITFVAFTALNKLLPYHQSQQEKIAEITLEVQETEVRVNKLREKFDRNFDPAQTKRVIQRNTDKVDPNRRPIIFIKDKN